MYAQIELQLSFPKKFSLTIKGDNQPYTESFDLIEFVLIRTTYQG